MSFELLNRPLFISRVLKNYSIFLTTLQNKTAIGIYRVFFFYKKPVYKKPYTRHAKI